MPLRTSGRYSETIRNLVRHASGVYAVREVGARVPLYVGLSDGGRYPERWWKTILRHLQPGSGKFEHARARYGVPSEWVYKKSNDLEIALWPAPPEETYELETRLIGKLAPLHVKTSPRGASKEEEVPF